MAVTDTDGSAGSQLIDAAMDSAAGPLRVLVFGATGYIGRCVTRELVARGHGVVAFARERSGIGGRSTPEQSRVQLGGAEVRFGDVSDPGSIRAEGLRGEHFDAVVCCLASRNGGVQDSWKIDYQASLHTLEAARAAGADHFVLLSAICVQKPDLAFQQAKLQFEQALMNSGLRYSIVRPTAFFKSLAAQVEPVKKGFPYVLVGDGEGASCKPISETDLAAFIADCLIDSDRQNRILPIGGPGEALSARAQGELLFELSGRKPWFVRVPVALFDGVIALLACLAGVFPQLLDAAEFARIGRYYACESMLVYDAERQCYDAAATPSTGQDTLRAFYARVLRDGLAGQELGDQALFRHPDA